VWHYGSKKQVIHISSASNTQIINSKYKPDYEVLGDIKHILKALSLDVETPKQPNRQLSQNCKNDTTKFTSIKILLMTLH
jgi:thiamine pyrophosphate-dependent acetolactate synthase large subunit-like protein